MAPRGLVEGLTQLSLRGLAAVEPAARLEAHRRIAMAGLEAGQRAALPQRRLTQLQIVTQRLMALIAAFGLFVQAMRHHLSQGREDLMVARRRHRRGDGEVRMDCSRRILDAEWRRAGQRLQQRGAEAVEVGAVVDIAAHAAGQLRRERRERGLDQLGPLHQRAFAFDLGGQAQVRDQRPAFLAASAGQQQDLSGSEIAMNQPMAVEVSQRLDQIERDLDQLVVVQGAAAQAVAQRFRAERRQQQRGAAVVLDQGRGAKDESGLQALRQLVLAAQARDGGGFGVGIAQALEHRTAAGAIADLDDLGPAALVERPLRLPSPWIGRLPRCSVRHPVRSLLSADCNGRTRRTCADSPSSGPRIGEEAEESDSSGAATDSTPSPPKGARGKRARESRGAGDLRRLSSRT